MHLHLSVPKYYYVTISYAARIKVQVCLLKAVDLAVMTKREREKAMIFLCG